MRRAMLFSGGEHRLDDIVVSRATAKIALKLVANRCFVENAVMTLDHVDRRHDHAGRAKTALQSVMLMKGRLHIVQLLAIGQAFDRGNRCARQSTPQGSCRI